MCRVKPKLCPVGNQRHQTLCEQRTKAEGERAGSSSPRIELGDSFQTRYIKENAYQINTYILAVLYMKSSYT